jgi:hypothetical protein
MVLDPKAEVRLRAAAGSAVSARYLHGGTVRVDTACKELVLDAPGDRRGPVDSIVVLHKKP